MKKTIVYIAMSLDGYIADRNGDVDWLQGDGSDQNHAGSYPAFYDSIDTIILGYTTYHQIATQLFPNNWIYQGKKSYVLTHKNCDNKTDIIFTKQAIPNLIIDLKKATQKDIWICGGANIVNQCIDSDVIDRYCISIIPTILGKGIKLFHTHEKSHKLRFISTQSYNGITDLIYERENHN